MNVKVAACRVVSPTVRVRTIVPTFTAQALVLPLEFLTDDGRTVSAILLANQSILTSLAKSNHEAVGGPRRLGR